MRRLVSICPAIEAICEVLAENGIVPYSMMATRVWGCGHLGREGIVGRAGLGEECGIVGGDAFACGGCVAGYRGYVGLDERTEVVEVDVAHEVEGEVGGVGCHLMHEACDVVEVGGFEVGLSEHALEGRGVEGGEHLLVEDVVGGRSLVGEHCGCRLAHGFKLVAVEGHVGKCHVDELHECGGGLWG